MEALKEELESLRRCRDKVFQVPPLEWIQERLTKLKDILERNSERSGLLLRKLLGPLRLEPTCAAHNERPFYKATTSLNTLALVDPLEGEEREGGSNSLQWWTRGDSNPRPPRCERGALPAELLAHRFSRVNHYTSWGCERKSWDNWDNQIANFSAVALRFSGEKCEYRCVRRKLPFRLQTGSFSHSRPRPAFCSLVHV